MLTKREVYFFCCIGGDLLICSGISKLLKIVNPNIRTIVLLPNHPRLNNFNNNYLELFDEVIKLPFCDRHKNPIKLYNQTNQFCNELKKSIKQKDAYFFMFDVYEWVELLFYNVVSNLRKNNNAKLLTITAFNGGEFDKDKVSLKLFKTIYKSIHSLIFTNQIYYEYKTKGSNFDGLNFVKTYSDFQLSIQNSSFTSKSNLIFKNLFYPPLIFKLHDKLNNYFNKKLDFTYNSVVILLESQYLGSNSNYWEVTNEIILQIQKQGFKVLLKNHPSASNDCLGEIRSTDVFYLDNKLSFEEIVLSNSTSIQAVLGYGSTALITSSWLGVCCLDITNVYSLPQAINNRFADFIALGSNIQNCESIEDIKKLNSYINSNDKFPSLSQLVHQWEQISSEIFKNEI